MSNSMQWVVRVVLALLLSTCSKEPSPREGATNSAPLIDACSAANPVALLTAVAERTAGAPRLDVFRFDLPARAPICLRVGNPAIQGHRITAAEVILDGEELLSEDDFKQTIGSFALVRTLASGPHALEVRVGQSRERASS